MRKDTAKSSAFDINLSRKHRAIGAEIGRINARQIELLKKYAGNLSLWLGAGPELQTPCSHWVYLLGILLVQALLLDMSLY